MPVPVRENPKYVCEYKSISNSDLRLEIWESGVFSQTESVTLKAPGCIINYSGENIIGARLSFTIVDIDLREFISNNDFQFRVKFYRDNKIEFDGWLLQDDYSEDVVSGIKEVTLTATDYLGLLKNITWTDENYLTDYYTINRLQVPKLDNNTFKFDIPYEIHPGDVITMTPEINPQLPSPAFPFRRTVIAMSGSVAAHSQLVTFDQPVAGVGFNNFYKDVSFSEPIDKFGVERIGDILNSCLDLVRLDLPLLYMGRYQFIFDLMVNMKTFRNNETEIMNVYDIIDSILFSFRWRLQQRSGKWVIFQEDVSIMESVLRPYLFEKGFRNPISKPDERPKLQSDVININLNRSFKRPVHVIERKFDYEMIEPYFNNANLQELGRYYSPIDAYSAPYFYKTIPENQNPADPTIKIIRDEYGVETDRYLLINGGGAWVTEYQFVNKGDTMTISFNAINQNAPSVTANRFMTVVLIGDNGQNYSFNASINPLITVSPEGWTQITPYDHALSVVLGNYADFRKGIDVNIETDPIPVNGKMRIGFYYFPVGTQIRGFSATCSFRVNQNVNLKSQTNQIEDISDSLNKITHTISLDQTRRFNAKGSLFKSKSKLYDLEGQIQERFVREMASFNSKVNVAYTGQIKLPGWRQLDLCFIKPKDENKFFTSFENEYNYKDEILTGNFLEIGVNNNNHNEFKLKYIYESSR